MICSIVHMIWSYRHSKTRKTIIDHYLHNHGPLLPSWSIILQIGFSRQRQYDYMNVISYDHQIIWLDCMNIISSCYNHMNLIWYDHMNVLMIWYIMLCFDHKLWWYDIILWSYHMIIWNNHVIQSYNHFVIK